ncbi:MAG: hypothetical protein AVDCRST_MAG13-551, partial [uncultured Solirubrobacteraceae bacterium]
VRRPQRRAAVRTAGPHAVGCFRGARRIHHRAQGAPVRRGGGPREGRSQRPRLGQRPRQGPTGLLPPDVQRHSGAQRGAHPPGRQGRGRICGRRALHGQGRPDRLREGRRRDRPGHRQAPGRLLREHPQRQVPRRRAARPAAQGV